MIDYVGLSDEALVAELRASPDDDLRAFEELVSRYEQRVLTNCRYLSGSSADADDLAQEVMIKVFYGLAGFEGRSAFKTWLMRVKSNHCINFVKKRRLETVGLDDVQDGGRATAVQPGAWRDLERQEAARRVGEILLRMPDTLRSPLVLRDMDGLEYQERVRGEW